MIFGGKILVSMTTMKQTTLIITLSLLLIPPLPAQSSQSPGSLSISQQLYSFSPLARIILKHLGLEDKNHNGVIDKGMNEGYEAFITKYGNADIGFFANGITYGANNARLEEPEIVNHYYTSIRFKPSFSKETSAIENEITTYIYANDIPLIWLDDKWGSVMNVVNHILGEGWQNKQVSVSEAEKMFMQVMNKLKINSLPGTPDNSGYGYKQLTNFIGRREGYCFEVAQFGFWFFSQLKIKSIDVEAALEPNLIHGVIKLPDNNKIIDYFGASKYYSISVNQWIICNPLQCISYYYYVQGRIGKTNYIIGYYEKAAVYDKYDISTVSLLVEKYANSGFPNHEEIIALGEFILNNTDIKSVLNSNYFGKAVVKNNLKLLIILLLESYSATKNRRGFDIMANLLNLYFSDTPDIQQHINKFRFKE
jgi:hypothetical protein